MGIITGDKAKIWIGSQDGTIFGISDFSLTIDRGTIEQPQVGTAGNRLAEGALSIDGSLTCCRFAASGNAPFLNSIVSSQVIKISGSVSGSSLLQWSFASCQVTGYDVAIGDANTITEASIDFTVLDPYNVTYSSGKIND